MSTDPTILAALISGIVSIAIAIIAGIITIWSSRRETRRTVERILSESQAQRFLEDAEKYRKRCEDFLNEHQRLVSELDNVDKGDGLRLVQNIVTFNTFTRDFIRDNTKFLGQLSEKLSISLIEEKFIKANALPRDSSDRLLLITEASKAALEAFKLTKKELNRIA